MGTVFIAFCLSLMFAGLMLYNGGLGIAAVTVTAFFLLVKRRYSRVGGTLFWVGWLLLLGGFLLLPQPDGQDDFTSGWTAKSPKTASLDVPVKQLEVPPIPANGVADLAGMFSAAEMRQIAAALMTLTEKTRGGQLAVLTIPSLGDAVLEDFSLQVARTWQLGQANQDNGALLLLVQSPRRTRLEIGLGWEGPIPDGKAGEILDNLIAWERDGKLAKGVVTAVEQVGYCVCLENDSVEVPGQTHDERTVDIGRTVHELHLWTYVLLPFVLLLCPLFWLGRVLGRFTDRLGLTKQWGENGGALYHLLVFMLMLLARSSGRGSYSRGGWGGSHGGGGFRGGGGHFGGGGASR